MRWPENQRRRPDLTTPVAPRPCADAVWPVLAARRAGAVVGLAEQALPLLNRLEAELAEIEGDGALLAQVYGLDGLFARIRRLACGLRVLADARGEEFSGQVSSLLEVAESAAASVEHHARLRIEAVADVAVLAYASDDVALLLAELVDNATRYARSAWVNAVSTGDGSVAIRIEDDGFGVEGMAVVNRCLAGPVTALDADTPVRGGFAVAHRLARRHGVTVRLSGRGAGRRGTLVTVTLPPLLVCGPQRAAPSAVAHRAVAAAEAPAAGSELTQARVVPRLPADRGGPPPGGAGRAPGGLSVREPATPAGGRPASAFSPQRDMAAGARAFAVDPGDLDAVGRVASPPGRWPVASPDERRM